MPVMQKTIAFRVRADQYEALKQVAAGDRRYRHGLQPNVSAAARAALDAGLEKLKEDTEENDGN